MALFKEDYMVSPSGDIRLQSDLDNTELESGLYYCVDTVTISAASVSITASLWTVICISSETRTSLHCYTQIWIPADSSVTNQAAFIRTSESGSTWSNWSVLLSNSRGVQNGTAGDVRLVISNTQPAAISGVTQVWIDTSV